MLLVYLDITVSFNYYIALLSVLTDSLIFIVASLLFTFSFLVVCISARNENACLVLSVFSRRETKNEMKWRRKNEYYRE